MCLPRQAQVQGCIVNNAIKKSLQRLLNLSAILMNKSDTNRFGWLLLTLFTLLLSKPTLAKDHFLTIGGGYLPSGNQASLERNVLYFQRTLEDRFEMGFEHDIFFADGNDAGKDLQVMDRDSVPEPNRMMAEFFGTQRYLGVSYRDHDIENVRDSTKPENLKKWFKEEGTKLNSGDRLFIYVTSHGNGSSDKKQPHNTTIATWGRSSLSVKEMAESLDLLNEEVTIVVVMVQCHAGGFARLIYQDADPEKGISPQRRVGFFATVHDRPAAGCTPDINEANYAEYSSYFIAALSGIDRLGQTIDQPDYDGDGKISFEEAHAYVILTADTIDFPIKTSDIFLDEFSEFGEEESDLLADDLPYDQVLALANPVEKEVLEGLSKQLKLEGNNRLVDAYNVLHPEKKEGEKRRPRQPPEREKLRMRIREDLRKKWPELSNLLNPTSIELLTTRCEEFMDAVKTHDSFEKYSELKEKAKNELNDTERKVKYDRFLRVADHIILRENLKRKNDEARLQEFNDLVKAEASFL